MTKGINDSKIKTELRQQQKKQKKTEGTTVRADYVFCSLFLLQRTLGRKEIAQGEEEGSGENRGRERKRAESIERERIEKDIIV